MKKFLSILFLLCHFSALSQYYRLGEEFVSQAISLELPNKKVVGSGVVVKVDSFIILVTAKHVLLKESIDSITKKKKSQFRTAKLIGSFYSGDPYITEQYSFSIDLVMANSQNLIRAHQNRDIAIVFLGKVSDSSLIIFYSWVDKINISNNVVLSVVRQEDLCSFSELRGGDESFTIGYPTSLDLTKSRQYNFKKPLIGKGIVSGKDHRNKTFVVDIPAFPGNSGGPVFVLIDNEAKLAGIVVEYIPYTISFPIGLSKDKYGIINSGYSVVVSIEDIYSLIGRK